MLEEVRLAPSTVAFLFGDVKGKSKTESYCFGNLRMFINITPNEWLSEYLRNAAKLECLQFCNRGGLVILLVEVLVGAGALLMAGGSF